MHQYQERQKGEENRKPDGKTLVKDMESEGLKVEDVLDRTKWKREIKNHVEKNN